MLVIYQKKSSFGRRVAAYLSAAGCKSYPYEDLNPISENDYQLSHYIWKRQDVDVGNAQIKPTILLIARQYGFLVTVVAEG